MHQLREQEIKIKRTEVRNQKGSHRKEKRWRVTKRNREIIIRRDKKRVIKRNREIEKEGETKRE